MSAQVLDGTVAVLWGSAERSLTWVHLDPKHGTVTVAKATASGFMVRELWPVEGLTSIGARAYMAWRRLRDGEDLSHKATHHLAPPSMQIIEPIPAKDEA
jgi:hypothetical protein